ncbi:MAG: hypothetical protein JXB06_05905 [Spirochaetales bacterium]|nr:hypothetical protein [Spirochaetales bacterium]
MSRSTEKNRRVVPRVRLLSGWLVRALSLCSLLLLSCATVPPPQEAASWIGVLPPLSADSLYASVRVASSWDLVELLAETTGIDTRELEKSAARVDRLHARICLSPGQLPAFSMVALGKLKPGSVACRLNLDSAWRRVVLEPLPGGGFGGSSRSYRTYWDSGELQIAAPRAGVLFVSGGEPSGTEALLRRLGSPGPNPVPGRAAADLETADIFLYIPDPVALAVASRAPSSSSQDFGAVLQRLPIRQMWVCARRIDPERAGDSYELAIVFMLAEGENPRSVEMLVRLMLTLWMRQAQVDDAVGKLKAVTFGSDPSSVWVESLVLGSGEIASFMQSLLPDDPGGGGKL